MNTTRPAFPHWTPALEPGNRLLVVGSSGGIGSALARLAARGGPCVLGCHRAGGAPPLPDPPQGVRALDLPATLATDADCRELVERFRAEAGGLDGLAVLCGGIARHAHWRELTQEEWQADLHLNLTLPFLLARAALEVMEPGGAVVLLGTESALHGGGAMSLAYGTAKRGVECLVQGLAREAAQRGVTVNGVRPGFIASGFHQRWQGATPEAAARRTGSIPLGRAGTPEEAAALILYLLSGWARFITGQMFAITGGDWL